VQYEVRRGLRPFRCSLIALALAPGSVSCSGESESPSFLKVMLSGQDELVPANYRVILAADSQARAIDCPSPESVQELSCSDHGVEIERAQPGATLLIKVPGHHFERRQLSESDVQNGALDVKLVPLPTAELTADYATGFSSAEAAEAAFSSLAVSGPTELGRARSVKFYIAELTSEPKVYFQNTRRYPLHYEFANRVLHVVTSPQEFERSVYHGDSRIAAAGTLVDYPELDGVTGNDELGLSAPVTLQFFPSDELGPELVEKVYLLVEERLALLARSGAERRLVYVPANVEREQDVSRGASLLAASDVVVRRQAELFAGVTEQSLNPGLCYGTLRSATPEALARGAFSAKDVLILTRLPNDLPLLAGTISEELQTPLSHVNVAARARGTPNLALRNASRDPRIQPWLDRLVRFEVTTRGFSLMPASLAEAEAHWASVAHPRLVPEADLEYSSLPPFEELAFEDSRRVGVKAANLGQLRQVLGAEAPPGFAVPFSAYHQHLVQNQVTPALCELARASCESTLDGRAACLLASEDCNAAAGARLSLADHIAAVISRADVRVNSELRRASLLVIQALIRNAAVDSTFGAALDARAAEIFGENQLRLRSSTNAEDLPEFSGAGLYESVSARASGGNAASRRIPLVWASVWSFAAFEERTFFNIDHLAVHMGVAVNPAADDEVVNGVIVTKNLLASGAAGYYLNLQAGEISVTNPTGGETPEVVTVAPADAGGAIVRQRYSSLSPGQPLLSESELAYVAERVQTVVRHFAPLYGKSESELVLDLEVKWVGPQRALSIKQARPYKTK
jgi:hypothetical protein